MKLGTVPVFSRCFKAPPKGEPEHLDFYAVIEIT